MTISVTRHHTVKHYIARNVTIDSVILLIHYCVLSPLSKKQMKRNTQTIQSDEREIMHYCFKLLIGCRLKRVQ